MTGVVIDASTALAWCFPDESSDDADKVLIALEKHTILVPAVWNLELANALIVGERRKRIGQAEINRFTTLLENLSIMQDRQSVSESLRNVLPLARVHGLTAYDAAYLELSIRHNAPLATTDGKLLKEAKAAGIGIFRS